MPSFQTAEEIASHLRQVMRDRSAWVFVVDGPEGHRRIAALALALYARWGEEKAARRLRYGCCSFLNGPTRHEATLSILTITKAHLPGSWVDMFLQEAGVGPERGGRDLILMPENGDARPDGVIPLFLMAVHDGYAHPDTSPNN